VRRAADPLKNRYEQRDHMRTKEEWREYHRNYYYQNWLKRTEQFKKYRQNEAAKMRKERTKEHRKEYAREYRAKYLSDPQNIQKDRYRIKRWRMENPEKAKRRLQEWSLKNPEKVKINSIITANNRRARLLNARVCTDRKAYRAFVVDAKSREMFTCHWCRQNCKRKSLHIDHVVPLSKGGDDDVKNLCLSCDECNLSKGRKMPADFMLEVEARDL
jgi:5-methylcytosine-specific restriction endonuclease McrA